MHLLRGVLLELGSELQEENLTDRETMGTQSEMTEVKVVIGACPLLCLCVCV